MRAPSSGIAGQLTATVSQPGFLVQITLPSGPAYLTDLDADFPYNGQVFAASDMQVQGLSWTGGAPQRPKLILGDADLTWGTLALNLELQDCAVSIWQAYAAAPNEAEPLWSGRIGGAQRDNAVVQCSLVLDTSTAYSPRRRVQTVINGQFLLPAGKTIAVGSQKWVIGRPRNG